MEVLFAATETERARPGRSEVEEAADAGICFSRREGLTPLRARKGALRNLLKLGSSRLPERRKRNLAHAWPIQYTEPNTHRTCP